MNGFTSDDVLLWLGSLAYGGIASLTGFGAAGPGALTIVGILGLLLLAQSVFITENADTL